MLVVFDVDDFKQINDRYGHMKGDLCLADIAECIKKAYASFGYCYRIGGDEFCVITEKRRQREECKQEFLQAVDRETRKDCIFTNSFLRISSIFR